MVALRSLTVEHDAPRVRVRRVWRRRRRGLATARLVRIHDYCRPLRTWEQERVTAYTRGYTHVHDFALALSWWRARYERQSPPEASPPAT